MKRYILSSGAKGYFYTITNAQGDVIGLKSGAGDVIARYNYDTWGKLLSITDANGTPLAEDSFAHQVSVRYRGYYYDTETGLYYLQSRYYDPETGRFLNADDAYCLGATGNQLSYNAFAYCENDPGDGRDTSGTYMTEEDLKIKLEKTIPKTNGYYLAVKKNVVIKKYPVIYHTGYRKLLSLDIDLTNIV